LPLWERRGREKEKGCVLIAALFCLFRDFSLDATVFSPEGPNVSGRLFLPRRGQTYQPRASPWEEAVVAPLQGLPVRCLPNPGRCPGWYVVAPLGLKSGPERPNGGRLWPEGPKHSRVEREVSYFSTFCTSALPVTANSIRYEKNLLSQNRVLNSIKFAHNPGIFCTPSWPSLESP
jgi:hypothetical protein